MPLQREVLANRTKAREILLRAFQVAKAAHATLGFACRLIAVFGSVIKPGSRFDEYVLHARKLRDLGSGGR
ncbi:hypothetical protein AXG89_32380 (plasmid) [Burkholderia sp. PAMC 26561]|nr:hypothetical protein AXG89_32380 [Burkholderia sp. PAMC 26561]